MKQKTYLDKLMENPEFKEKFEEEYVNLQTNANREEKNIVEVWDWADTGHTDNKFMKKYCRRLRRRRENLYRHLWWRIY